MFLQMILIHVRLKLSIFSATFTVRLEKTITIIYLKVFMSLFVASF